MREKIFDRRTGRSRRWQALVLAFCVGLALTGCQNSSKGTKVETNQSKPAATGETTSQNDKIKVVTTIFPYYDFVRQIAGDLVDLTMIVPAGMDTHSFEPTAEDMITMGQADVLIYNGGEMESWVPKVVEAAENPNLFADAMINYVDTFVEEHVEGMEEEIEHDADDVHDDDGHDSENGEIDEHIWTSPDNAEEIVEQIAKDLVKADPANKATYLKNAEKYINQLEKLDRQFEQITRNASNRYLVFADRFPLRYFVEEYDLDYTAAFAGCSSDTEPSAQTIAYLTNQVKKRKLPVILKIELTSSRVADSISEATGARVETFHTCHNVTKEEFESGVTYCSLMEKNVSVLKDALMGK